MRRKRFFEITAVHRDDVKEVFPTVRGELIDHLPDEAMEELARWMHDAYLTNEFWIDIDILMPDILEKYGIIVPEEE